ncbi:SMI1/KNR4 family protein [Prosthecobacter sp.]|uniref:SMI1/KNR4 family protein n=1 Tax=Prosthecobacter sp. TaxID=1965333 RepID=UPI003783136E
MPLTPLSTSELDVLRTRFSSLPGDYFQFLSLQGHGEVVEGLNLYSAPVEGKDKDALWVEKYPRMVFFAEDDAGMHYAFDLSAPSIITAIDSYDMRATAVEETFSAFIDRFKESRKKLALKDQMAAKSNEQLKKFLANSPEHSSDEVLAAQNTLAQRDAHVKSVLEKQETKRLSERNRIRGFAGVGILAGFLMTSFDLGHRWFDWFHIPNTSQSGYELLYIGLFTLAQAILLAMVPTFDLLRINGIMLLINGYLFFGMGLTLHNYFPQIIAVLLLVQGGNALRFKKTPKD